jgi:hypothetical protein
MTSSRRLLPTAGQTRRMSLGAHRPMPAGRGLWLRTSLDGLASIVAHPAEVRLLRSTSSTAAPLTKVLCALGARGPQSACRKNTSRAAARTPRRVARSATSSSPAAPQTTRRRSPVSRLGGLPCRPTPCPPSPRFEPARLLQRRNGRRRDRTGWTWTLSATHKWVAVASAATPVLTRNRPLDTGACSHPSVSPNARPPF